MSYETFLIWFESQPGLVRDAVLFGPPLLVVLAIGLFLGARIDVLLLALRWNPAVAAGVDSLRSEREGDQDREWKRDAEAALDDAIFRHHGAPVRQVDDKGRD